MTYKRQAGDYYAERMVQTSFRERGDGENKFREDHVAFGNNVDAYNRVAMWERAPADGQMYAFVGYKP